MPKSLYELLEVHPNASQDAIQAAYKRLSEKFDPASAAFQSGTEAHAGMIAVREAFGILGNPEKRKKYDATSGKLAVPANASAPAPGFVSYEDMDGSGWTFQRVLVVALVVVIAGATYFHFQQKAEERALEVQRLAAEKVEAARAAEAERTHQLRLIQDARAKEIQAARERQDMQQFTRDANQHERERSYARQNDERRKEADAQRIERTRVAQEREAYNRAKAEEAELERKLKQREYEEQTRVPRVLYIPRK
jgi:curved DNA-binding protein CbpA